MREMLTLNLIVNSKQSLRLISAYNKDAASSLTLANTLVAIADELVDGKKTYSEILVEMITTLCQGAKDGTVTLDERTEGKIARGLNYTRLGDALNNKVGFDWDTVKLALRTAHKAVFGTAFNNGWLARCDAVATKPKKNKPRTQTWKPVVTATKTAITKAKGLPKRGKHLAEARAECKLLCKAVGLKSL